MADIITFVRLDNKFIVKNSLGKNLFFDLKMGLYGAIIMAFIVYLVNADHDPSGALIAASKQFVYTCLMGGIFTKMVENIAIKWDDKWMSLILAVIIPTLITIALTYFMHTLKGTPEPLNSTVPTTLTAPLSFSVWAYLKRSELEHQATENIF
ncbi:MAG: hypothetical protein V3V00_14555 [Saprospiraceae bacterium]